MRYGECIRQIILLDPETYTALRYRDGALIEGDIDALELPDGSKIPFPSAMLLEDLREELSRTE